MTMNRFLRIAELWNWLPAFRGVAEHESVNEAASVLHVSPSALSRTVKLLEAALEVDLFARKGSGMVLTPFGAQLLAVTRDAMRQIDDCIAAESERRGGRGPFHIGVSSELAGAVVARALATGLSALGTLRVLRVDQDDAADQLLRGDVDIVVTTRATALRDLVATRLGDLTFAAYAGSMRSLDGIATIVIDDAPVLADAVVAVRCESIDVARSMCERSELACVLPRLGWHPLVEIAPVGDPVALYALHRAALPTSRDDRLPVLVASVQDLLR